jgi:Flp pilus assembly protein TadG
MRSRPRPRRRGSAATELGLLLPFLAVCFVASIDFARLYYHYTIVTNCARNGALYASDPSDAGSSPYGSVTAAALADAGDLQPQPTVASTSGTDNAGNSYVEVTVVYPFSTISNYPGLTNPINLTRTVRMRVVAAAPN